MQRKSVLGGDRGMRRAGVVAASLLGELVSGPEARGEFQWCFTRDGILLLFSLEASGPEGPEGMDVRMEATSVSRDVSDAAFEPPSPVVD